MSRMNLQLTPRQRVALEDLADDLGVTKAEVLRRALALLEVALEESKLGNRIGIVRDNQVVKEVVGLDK